MEAASMRRLGSDERELRDGLLAALRRLDERGLNRGSTGNLSLRHGNGMLITPTGMGADDLVGRRPGVAGLRRVAEGRWKPSSEWHFHQALYLARPDLNAVAHTHATHATALACLRRDLPAFHYMVAVAGGDSVRCAPYHLFGTEALSRAVVQAMDAARPACWPRMGWSAPAVSLREAMKVMIEVESLCQTYLAVAVRGRAGVAGRGRDGRRDRALSGSYAAGRRCRPKARSPSTQAERSATEA
jgi:L-fuculose-phosphate aldolase